MVLSVFKGIFQDSISKVGYERFSSYHFYYALIILQYDAKQSGLLKSSVNEAIINI
jgi:hypothetical protein